LNFPVATILLVLFSVTLWFFKLII